MSARPGKSAALTLLETVLAISMLAMILLALHTALSSGTGAYRRCRDRSDRDTMAWGAIRLMGEDLQRLALQTPQAAPVLLGVPAAHGQASALLRLQTNARAAPGAKAMRVDYFFMPDDGGGALVRRSQAVDAPEDQGRYEIVAAGLRAVRLRYFDGQGWSDRWDSTGARGPRLVEVALELAAGEAPAQTYTEALPVGVEQALIAAPEEPRP